MKRVHSCPVDSVLVRVIVAKPLASASGGRDRALDTVPSRVVEDHAIKSVHEKVPCARVDVGRRTMDSSMTRSVVMDADELPLLVMVMMKKGRRDVLLFYLGHLALLIFVCLSISPKLFSRDYCNIIYDSANLWLAFASCAIN